MNDPADDPATPALAAQTLAAQTLAAQTLAAQTLVSVLVNVFQPLPCDFCPSAGPAYRDPETGCFYCLPCLEMATDETLVLEDGPEDAGAVALGRAALDELLPATARRDSGPTR